MIRFAMVALVVAGLTILPVRAGEFNKKLNIGDSAPTWSNLPGVDGKNHSLADLQDKDVVVIAVTCNHCPVAAAYEDRIIAFSKKYAGASDSKVASGSHQCQQSRAGQTAQNEGTGRGEGFHFPLPLR